MVGQSTRVKFMLVMIRIVLGILLLVLGMGVLVDWPWSHYTTKRFQFHRRGVGDRYWLNMLVPLDDVRGHIVILYYRPLFALPPSSALPTPTANKFWQFSTSPCNDDSISGTAEWSQPPRSLGNGFGFWFESVHVATSKPSENYQKYVIALPHWFLALLCLASSRSLLRRPWINYRRKRQCLCLQCGYDLRASPERCPECGLVVPARCSISINPPASGPG